MSVKKNINKKFGTYIREIRIDQGIGQRELASNVGIAASYLNDIEKGKRAAPKQIIIKKLSSLLKVDINYLNDLAGATKENIAPDISEFIKNNPRLVSLIRSIKEKNINNEQIKKLKFIK